MLIYLLQISLAQIVGFSPLKPQTFCEIDDSNKENFSGYHVDLLRQVFKDLNWNDQNIQFRCMHPVQLVQAIQQGTIDIAYSPSIEVTELNLDRIKFGISTGNQGLVLLVKKNQASALWIFLQPFDFTLWIVLIFTGIFQAHIHWMIERDDEGEIPFEYRTGILESLWHTFAAFFMVGDKQIRTVPGRIIQVAYWFMAFVIIAVYTADLTVRLSEPLVTYSIQDYQDIEDKKVATFMQYANAISELKANPKQFEQTDQDIELMLENLNDGTVDAVAIELPLATYYQSYDCDIQIRGTTFIPAFHTVAFKQTFSNQLIQDFNIAWAKQFDWFERRAIENQYIFQTDEEKCSYIVEKPIGVNVIGGLWIVIGIGVGVSLPIYFIYRKYRRIGEEDEEEKSDEEEGKFDNSQAAEIDLMTKFEQILMSSHGKFQQKLKDFQSAIDLHNSESDKFEESIHNLLERLLQITNDIDE